MAGNLANFQKRFRFVSKLQILFDDMLEKPTHDVCDGPNGCADKTVSNFQGGRWSISIDPDNVNMCNASLDFI